MTDGRPRLELISVAGDPSDEEKTALQVALDRIHDQERQARSSSLWLRAGRAQGRRLGMLDYRDRFAKDDAWRLSARFPFGGREYPGLNGRGDTKQLLSLSVALCATYREKNLVSGPPGKAPQARRRVRKTVEHPDKYS